ncbi:MAG TPA: GNAT family N-acetyltransferase [Acidimicrobiia bacterium]|nr:GNAT family N-acetyltransferase [Acidimicrobiia bacterium]
MTRWARLSDADSLADVHVTTWQRAYEGIFPSSFLAGLDRKARAKSWRRQLETGARVNVIGEPVVGFCFAGNSDDEGWGEVFAIYVHPDHWDQGLGFQLLRAGESQLRDDGHQRALLWVLRDNHRARRFYERQGWRIGKPVRLEEIGGVQVTEVRYETGL